MLESDGFYIQRCLDGHPDDFRHLVKRYQKPLMAHLTGQLGNRDLAEETAQEVFVRCYFGLSSLKKPESIFAWMLGIAGNVVKERIRTEQRERQSAEKLSQTPVQRKGDCDWPLAKAVAKLDDFYQQLILLRYYGGHSCKDISEMTNVPIGTVTKSLSRAYDQLRQMLKAEQTEVRK